MFSDIYSYHKKKTIMIKICEFCKKEFDAHHQKQRCCSKKCAGSKKQIKKETRICELVSCGKTFMAYPISKQRLCSRECQIKWQKINMCGEKNPNFGNRKPNMFKHTKEAKELIRKKVKESWKKEERLIKHLKFFDRHRNSDGSMDWHSDEFREKISKANIRRLENNDEYFSYKTYVKGFILNIITQEQEYYHSSWELNKMIELNENKNVLFWTKKHGIHVEYYYKGRKKNYLPDFYVEYKDGIKKIEEIKGYVDDEELLKLKIIAGKKYCKDNNMSYTIDYVENKNRYKHLIEWEKELE